MPIKLRAKIQNPAQPVIFYELIPPRADAPAELESRLQLIRETGTVVDAINIPEIRDESRQGSRRARLPDRMEPRAFAQAIHAASDTETIVNRVTVHESAAEQELWMRQTYDRYGVRNLILVGGESHAARYPGPGVTEAARLASEAGLNFLLGGITIPSRPREADRIRHKYEHGLRFFTTQVLLDSNDIVDLIQALNGLDVRIVVSFAPISDARDVDFLQWLGVDVPDNVSWAVLQAGSPAKAVEKSRALATRILTDIFNNLPPHPPALGINVEQITRRNYTYSVQMLKELSGFYRPLLEARFRAASEPRRTDPASLAGRQRTSLP